MSGSVVKMFCQPKVLHVIKEPSESIYYKMLRYHMAFGCFSMFQFQSINETETFHCICDNV